MFKQLRKKAQTTAEYAILIALVVGAVIAMQVYVRRALQGKIKDAVDYQDKSGLGTNFTFNTTQYEPYYFDSTSKTDQKQSVKEEMSSTGVVTRTIGSDSAVARNASIASPKYMNAT